MSAAVATGLVAGYVADLILGDPRRLHPVAGFGRLAAALEDRLYRDDRAVGVIHVAGSAGVATLAAVLADRAVRSRPGGRMLVTAALTWTALGGTSLAREASRLAGSLAEGDIAGARRQLPSLCGRDPSALDAADILRATVESLAENTSDAVVGPLVWGAVAGPAGVAAYRAVNTLDAMVGYRTSRYLRFGWAAARLDDVLNALPARLSAALAILASGLVGGRPATSAQTWRRCAGGHPSPNAGHVESAFAGALGVRLGGSENRYGDHVDRRPEMGDGRAPTVADVVRAIRLSRAVGVGALAVSVLAAAVAAPGRRR